MSAPPAARPAAGPVRLALDGLYDGCAWIAAGCLILILISVLLQIAGGTFGFYVRGTDAYAGYAMAGASFFALAHTLRRGGHIRVTLLIQRLREPWRRAMEVGCCGAGAGLAGAFAWYGWKMVWWSWRYRDISMAEDRMPLWIPQIAMAFGATVFAIALLDRFVIVVTGSRPEAPPDVSGPAAPGAAE